VLLPVPLTITPEFKPPLLGNDIEVKLKASWLVCRTECIPQDGEFVLRLPIRGSTALNGASFEAAQAAQPHALKAQSRVDIEGNTLKVSVTGLPAGLNGTTLDFFPETAGVIETSAKWTQAWSSNGMDGVWTANIPLAAQRTQSPDAMPFVLVAGDGAQRQGYLAQAKVNGTWPEVAPLPDLIPAIIVTPPVNAAPSALVLGNQGLSVGFLAALAGALLGGLILNLMPCVFPVLAIKVIGFTRHADDRRGHRISGLAYSAGVVLSFLALGALMLALRSAGEQLGWGFQLQSPAVVAALAVLFTVLGLNLAGVFHFGHFLPSSVMVLESKNPAANAFLSGILAVAVAAPCTAPFMGASLGLALSLPTVQALLIFGTLGLGMALPFLAAAFVPAVARLMPRPGAWMETFRNAMAFPMFATVAWLVWVLGQQSGIDGAGSLLALLVALSLTIWAFTLSGRSRTVLAILSVAFMALLLGALGPNVVKHVASTRITALGERWQPWAPGRVEQVLATGSPVFVDFTAAWCVTCQYNKKTTLSNIDVLADLDAKNVTLLRADWTQRDPAITAALSQLGRNGVPVYVIYARGRAPVLLSEILSVQEVRSALASL
jgi:thiol:disulfide interchange protein DsbD